MGPSRMHAMQHVCYKTMESGYNAWKEHLLYVLMHLCAIYLCLYSLNATPLIMSYYGSSFINTGVMACSTIFTNIMTYLNQQKKIYGTSTFHSLIKYYMINQTRIFLCLLLCQYHYLIGFVIVVIDLLMNKENGIVKNLTIFTKSMS
jgi:hypothetical protein